MNTDWETRVQAYERQGLTRSDAQGVVDAEDMKAARPRQYGPLKNSSGFLIGAIAKYPDGYRFIPNNAVHKSSRKSWPTPEACVPRWARKLLK